MVLWLESLPLDRPSWVLKTLGLGRLKIFLFLKFHYLRRYKKNPTAAIAKGTVVRRRGWGRVQAPHSGPSRMPTCDTNRRTP